MKSLVFDFFRSDFLLFRTGKPETTKPLLQVVLLGESFGGLLSLAVALRLGREKLKGPKLSVPTWGVSYQNKWSWLNVLQLFFHLQMNQHLADYTAWKLFWFDVFICVKLSPQLAQASKKEASMSC